MNTATTRPGRPAALTALTLLGLAIGACDVGQELDQDSLDLRGGRKPDAGAPPNATDPATGSPNAGSGSGPAMPPPPAAPSACVTRQSGDQVCVVCTDPDGKVVKEGCYTRDPGPANTECHDVKRNDGTVCTVCLDARGTVVKAACRSPEPSTCTPGMVPPGQPVTCRDYMDGTSKCTICIDATGKLVRQGCTPTMTPPSPPEPVMCEEKKYPDGTVCSICTDSRGQVIRRGCSSPMMPGTPPPPPAPDSRCREERRADGQVCVTCFDEKGNQVRQACWYPERMTPGMGAGTTPAGGANN